MSENFNKIDIRSCDFAVDYAQKAVKYCFEETVKYRNALAIIKNIINSPTNKDDLNHKINCIYLICSNIFEKHK